jgi:parvulin-like peptidyl-prolyl isomerase
MQPPPRCDQQRPSLRGGASLVAACALIASTLAACASTRDARQAPRADAEGAPRAVEARADNTARGDLVALVDGNAIEWRALRTPIVEAAGAVVLRDAVLDARLARRLAAEGRTVTAEMVEREREVLLELLLETLDADRERALDLLAGLRARQGLGPVRFEALLRRNAGLRAIVARSVQLDQAGLDSMYDLRHGPKRVARVAVLASLAEAERFRADLAAGGGAGDFARLAVERSLDESAARGGLLAPIARRDPSYPETLRATIYATAVGAVSEPALDGARFFVVEVLEERAGDGADPKAVEAACAQYLRLSRERLLMDALARELSSLEGVTVFDRAFDG